MCEEIYCVLQNALSFIIAFRNIQTLCATILAHWILVLSVWKKNKTEKSFRTIGCTKCDKIIRDYVWAVAETLL
jgi:hypothetical protein